MLVIKPDPHNDTADSKRLSAYIDDMPCGYVRFHHRGYILVLDELLPLPDSVGAIEPETYRILDLLIRALGSYGLNHSCFYLECENPMLYPVLEQLRFYSGDGIMKSDLGRILRSSH